MTEQPRASGLERFLNLFTVVRPGEARTALLLALNVFLILMAYYILKTVREALILAEGSAELKSYLSAGQVVALAFAVPGPDLIRVPLAYPIGKRDARLANFVNTWIALKRKDGTIDATYKHWILGQDAAPRQPRWSIVRNVLHWME